MDEDLKKLLEGTAAETFQHVEVVIEQLETKIEVFHDEPVAYFVAKLEHFEDLLPGTIAIRDDKDSMLRRSS